MKGVVEQVWDNESRNGQRYLTVQIGGERYSVWDTKYFDQLRQGAEIEYEFRESGNFKNITELRDPGQKTEAQAQPQPYSNHRDRQITMLSCLKSAAEILAPAQIDPDVKRDLVIQTAKVFERYVGEDEPGSLPPEQDRR